MGMRKLITSLIVAVSACSLSAEQFVRVNEAGYFPNGRKNLVIISDEDIAGQGWSIVDKSGSSLLSGTVKAAKAGVGDYSPKQFNYRVDFSDMKTEGEFIFQVGKRECAHKNDVQADHGDGKYAFVRHANK